MPSNTHSSHKKPSSTFLKKAKPYLVLHGQRSEEISSRSLGSLVNPENADEREEVERSSRQLVLPDPKRQAQRCHR